MTTQKENDVQDERSMILQNALQEYIKLLKESSYFEAHEVLEKAWHPLRKAGHPLKDPVKGLINGAISFEHLKRNRKNAVRKARITIASYEKHKKTIAQTVECKTLLTEACAQIERLKRRYPEVFGTVAP